MWDANDRSMPLQAVQLLLFFPGAGPGGEVQVSQSGPPSLASCPHCRRCCCCWQPAAGRPQRRRATGRGRRPFLRRPTRAASCAASDASLSALFSPPPSAVGAVARQFPVIPSSSGGMWIVGFFGGINGMPKNIVASAADAAAARGEEKGRRCVWYITRTGTLVRCPYNSMRDMAP